MRRGQLLSRRRLGKGPKECRNWIGEDFFPLSSFHCPVFCHRWKFSAICESCLRKTFLDFLSNSHSALLWLHSLSTAGIIVKELLRWKNDEAACTCRCGDGEAARRCVRVRARVWVCEHVHVRLCFCMSAYNFGWGGKGKLEKKSGRRWEKEKKRDCESEMERERKWRTKVKPRQGEVVTVREDRGRCLRFVVLTRW